jgi:hypothetical protein
MSAWAVRPLALSVVPEHLVIIGTTGTGVHGRTLWEGPESADPLGPCPPGNGQGPGPADRTLTHRW